MSESNLNNEPVSFGSELIPLIDHLVYNKRLISSYKDKLGDRFGYFKKLIVGNKEILQIHVRIPIRPGKDQWFWFNVIDANEKEKDLNRRLNVQKMEVKP